MTKSKYEYIRIEIDFGDLEQLNRFGQDGWQLVQVVYSDDINFHKFYAMLERKTD